VGIDKSPLVQPALGPRFQFAQRSAGVVPAAGVQMGFEDAHVRPKVVRVNLDRTPVVGHGEVVLTLRSVRVTATPPELAFRIQLHDAGQIGDPLLGLAANPVDIGAIVVESRILRVQIDSSCDRFQCARLVVQILVYVRRLRGALRSSWTRDSQTFGVRERGRQIPECDMRVRSHLQREGMTGVQRERLV